MSSQNEKHSPSGPPEEKKARISAGKIVAIAVGVCCFLVVLIIILVNVSAQTSLEPKGIEEGPDMPEVKKELSQLEKLNIRLCKKAMTKAT